MNEVKELEIVELGDAKEVTKGIGVDNTDASEPPFLQP